jgi:hypothetical protein
MRITRMIASAKYAVGSAYVASDLKTPVWESEHGKYDV